MEITIQFHEYSRQTGLRDTSIDGYEIDVSIEHVEVLISANKENFSRWQLISSPWRKTVSPRAIIFISDPNMDLNRTQAASSCEKSNVKPKDPRFQIRMSRIPIIMRNN